MPAPRLTHLGGALALGCAVVAMSAPVALATPPGDNGTIAFVRGTSQTGRALGTLNADGTNLHVLTLVGRSGFDASGLNPATAAISPDGTKIAFASDDNGDHVSLLYVTNVDGTDTHAITSGSGNDVQPTWFPNGAELLFSSTRSSADSELWRVGADGTSPQQITSMAGYDSSPAIAPDGVTIAWTHDGRVIELAGARNTANPVALTTNSCAHGAPSFSPDGNKLAFESHDNRLAGGGCIDADVEVVPVGNSAFPFPVTDFDSSRDITPHSGNDDATPVWSPDGTQLLTYASRPDPAISATGTVLGIWRTDIDGSNPTFLVSGASSFAAQSPSWSTVRRITETETPIVNDPTPSPVPAVTPTPAPTADSGPGGQAAGPGAGVAANGVTTNGGPSTTTTPVASVIVQATTVRPKKGAVALAVTAPAAGKVSVTGTGIVRAKRPTTVKAGKRSLNLTLTAAEAKKLRHDHKVKLHLTIVFQAPGGKAVVTQVTVTVTG